MDISPASQSFQIYQDSFPQGLLEGLPVQVRLALLVIKKRNLRLRIELTDYSDIEAHGKQNKCSRLELFLFYNFRDHGSHNSNISILSSTHGPKKQSLPERLGESKSNTRGNCAASQLVFLNLHQSPSISENDTFTGLHLRVPSSPINKTVFLPPRSLSANLPHAIAVRNCAAVKLLCMIPA